MKICAIGAGGTGKTTLMQMVANSLHLPYRPSVNRKIFEKFGHTQLTHVNLLPEERWKIQKASFDAKIEQDAEFSDGVFERNLLDHLMYCLLYCSAAIPDAELRVMRQQVLRNLHDYDRLYFFPIYPWTTQPADGWRDAGLANRQLQEYILRGFIVSNIIFVTTLPNDTPEGRLQWLLQSLNSE